MRARFTLDKDNLPALRGGGDLLFDQTRSFGLSGAARFDCVAAISGAGEQGAVACVAEYPATVAAVACGLSALRSVFGGDLRNIHSPAIFQDQTNRIRVSVRESLALISANEPGRIRAVAAEFPFKANDDLPRKGFSSCARRFFALSGLAVVVIAQACGVVVRTLARWKTDPEFRAEVERIRNEQRAAIEAEGIRRKINRVNSLVDDFEATQRLIQARAAAYTYAVGGDTGLLARDVKLTRLGDEIEVFRFDAALIAKRNELRKQIAQELGQWVEKTEATNTHQGPLVQILMPDNGRESAADNESEDDANA